MVRAVLYLFLAIIAITVLRAVIGILARGASELLGGGSGVQQQGPPAPPRGGELKKDPVCGTYVAASSEFRRDGQVFCSAACRDKYRA